MKPILVGFVIIACAVALSPDVTLSSGQIRGSCANGACSYRGVPFGGPASGAHRFQPPQPVSPWSDVFDATKWGVGCVSIHHNPDVGTEQSEDCLNLNVYAPSNADSSSNLPVMLFWYGGGFTEGDNYGPFGIYDGAHLASTYNVIVVAANYRLGAFGYLVIDQLGLHGNYGIQDQTLSMKWVQKEITKFGGNPNQVIIWGESAGAMSVGYHLVSPPSQGLFHAAIMESNPAALLARPNDKAELYGLDACAVLGCMDGLTCKLECLQQANTTQVSDAWKKAAGNDLIYILANWGHLLDGFLDFKPTVDGTILPDNVIALLQQDKWAKVPVMIGTNTNEGATFVMSADKSPLPMFLFDLAVDIVFSKAGKANTHAIINEYNTRRNNTDAYVAISELFTDFWFRCASEQFLNAAERAGVPGYMYRYNHVFSDSSLWPKFGLPAACEKLVCHATELPLVFHVKGIHNPQVNVTLTPAELELSTNMNNWWTSFAKGQLQNNAVNITWPKWDSAKRENIVLAEQLSTENSVDLCANLWDKVGYNF